MPLTLSLLPYHSITHASYSTFILASLCVVFERLFLRRCHGKDVYHLPSLFHETSTYPFSLYPLSSSFHLSYCPSLTKSPFVLHCPYQITEDPRGSISQRNPTLRSVSNVRRGRQI
ncbi:hypothetical protein QBC32DRAFT_113141 [Pseudoneurospora amorphoporcata]|uniref:Uncharacterized protein n=1 Tax=Pseudoneurospora amorphoporcata TaxID=241081 RepID=A0AAN6SHL3_9PEZI|nr:hypothetical protein QBC32DRAFT_113141 [Pseudoneurospora amorphoporcata]